MMWTDSGGRFRITEQEFGPQKYSPAKSLLSAFQNLGKQDLTFDEEYSLESPWHEIRYNMQKTTTKNYDFRSPENVMMETMTQWTARRTYQEMMSALGDFAPIHQNEIIRNGYGYQSSVTNFDSLLSKLGVRDEDIFDEINAIYLGTDRYDYLEPIAELLGKKSNTDKDRAPGSWIFRRISFRRF